MDRLRVLVEGQTEEMFVRELLGPHLCRLGYSSVDAKIMGNARLRTQRGGVRGWQETKRDIVRHLRQDRGVIVTTMVDYYALPQGSSAHRAWPGRSDANSQPVERRAATVESAIAADVLTEMGNSWDSSRFVPFVVMHEFESLLFSDCAAFARGIGRPDVEPDFSSIRKVFKSPEEIDDSPRTHPSRRVAALVPDYEKPFHGNLAAVAIGLESIRRECHHFRGWLDRLEAAVE